MQISVKEKVMEKLQNNCLELTKSDNLEIQLVALQTLITTIYAGMLLTFFFCFDMLSLHNKFISPYIASSTQLEQTEEANGVVQTEIQSNHIVLEVTYILFQMLRVSPANEATLIGLFLYHLIIDLSRPNDMLPFVTKEFLDCYHPYPFIVGKALYGVSRNNLLL